MVKIINANILRATNERTTPFNEEELDSIGFCLRELGDSSGIWKKEFRKIVFFQPKSWENYFQSRYIKNPNDIAFAKFAVFDAKLKGRPLYSGGIGGTVYVSFIAPPYHFEEIGNTSLDIPGDNPHRTMFYWDNKSQSVKQYPKPYYHSLEEYLLKTPCL